MTLYEIVQIIEEKAGMMPVIRTIVPNDVYDVSTRRDLKYGVFAWSQNQHRHTRAGSNYFSFNLFYIDRLDSENNNRLQVQSTAIETLKNIIRLVEEDGDLEIYGDVTFDTFTQRFADDCAGAYARITFIAEDETICGEDF